MNKKVVTEMDFRMPEFRHPSIKVEDYEFDGTGCVVRKDRWETGMRRIADLVDVEYPFTIDGVIKKVEILTDMDVVSFIDTLENTLAQLESGNHRPETRGELESMLQIFKGFKDLN